MKTTKVSGKNLEQYVENLKGKGEEYIARKLFEAKREIIELDSRLRERNVAAEYDKQEAKALREINSNLAYILERNGIRPKLLRITYQNEDCANCEYGFYVDPYGTGTEMQCSCEEEDYDCPMKTDVSTNSFYDYAIEDGELTGIAYNFNLESYDVIEVVDEKTGKSIWKKPKEPK